MAVGEDSVLDLKEPPVCFCEDVWVGTEVEK